MLRRRCLVIAGAALTVASAVGLAPPGTAGTQAPPPGAAAIPVLARFEVQQSRENPEPVARGAIHGVRRVAEGTVLYYSLGFPEDSGSEVSFLATRRSPQTSDRWGPDGSWATPFLVDPVGRRAYTGLVKQEYGDCVCSSLRATTDEPGKLFVLYVVLPPLPPETKAVHVGVGFDTVVRAIPVQDGAMTPEVEPTGPILLGDGWPRIDLPAVAAAHEKDRSVFDLETRVLDLERQVTTVESPDAISLELASDVLFPVDSAQLTPAAQETIARAAATINQRARGGTITVVGHTDDTGSDPYNDTLSRQRADSVRQALEPLVKVPGVTYSVDGKGEREPVETNATDSGRRSNRRVAVTFSPKDG